MHWAKWEAAPPALGLNRRDLSEHAGRPLRPPTGAFPLSLMTNVCISLGDNGKPPGMTKPRKDDLAQRMAELARAAAAPRSVDDVLSDVTSAAMELIPGADTAGVLLIGKGGKWDSVANTSDLPYRLDELQMLFNEGPCVEAALDELIVRTDDFRSEQRWPQYAAAVVEIGILSGLSFKLYTSDRTAGALNLFSFKPTAFDAEDETTGVVLAAHAAAAILASRHGEQLKSALSTRDRIGQAKGIIMERYGVDDLKAFEMLRRRRGEGFRDVAAALPGQQHQADRHRATGHRHPRRMIIRCAARHCRTSDTEATRFRRRVGRR